MLNNVIPKRSEGSRIHEMLPVAQRDVVEWHLVPVILSVAKDLFEYVGKFRFAQQDVIEVCSYSTC